ncbi:LADA_0G01926g1_1 [Lachancea dasiensis]|uniref:LADA_0G01926g1_1 n=1 Tax=Lachancea dasiensis TaxID=1072105 RepID=A0A1G4JQY5_9SACH|nr:LADA_0G01926g1_1 [Lachancea dasiensis]
MTKEDTVLSRRRAARKINYNEKDADEDVVRRIQHMEKTRESMHAASMNKIKVPKSKHQDYLNDKSVGWNFIPTLPPTFRKHSRFSNVLDLENATIDVNSDTLSQGSSVLLKRDDHIYMVSEPPGEPYYIGRIVQFVPKPEFRHLIGEGHKYTSSFPVKYFQVKMNWYYRPRDVQEKILNIHPRQLYASLHMDICPIHSFRGKCTVMHRSKLEAPQDDQNGVLAKPNTFYYDQLFDRYTLQYYDIWSTRQQLLKLGSNSTFLGTLAKLYPYVFAEENYPIEQVLQKYVLGTKVHDENEWDQRCAECGNWCEKNQCVKCDECRITVHLYCLDPPQERKPAKGVIWICSKCINSNNTAVERSHGIQHWDPLENQLNDFDQAKCLAGRPENIWFHYLGSKVVNNLRDILTPELMLPYPMKTLRTGSKFQWDGCVGDVWEPKPYHTGIGERGEDENMELLWKSDYSKLPENHLDGYVQKCQELFPPKLDILPQTCNFWDMILFILMTNDYSIENALKLCEKTLSRNALREPTLSKVEIKKFEEGVSKYGSELHPVCKLVGTQPMAMIVRYYYYWKKTPNGREIWGNFEGRKKNKNKSIMGSKKKTEDVNKKSRVRKPSKIFRDNDANIKEWKHIDDSSFDSEKISTLKTYFKCMFCEIDYSPLWYRITGGCNDDHIKTRMITGVNEKTSTSDKLPPRYKKNGKNELNSHLEALCIRCARLWRRYAVRWMTPMDVVKRVNGKYSSSVRAALDSLLSDCNNTVVRVPCSILFEKCIEWELVQDSELIIKQRFQVMGDLERLAKMKRNCIAVHGQLNKTVRRLTDKDADSDERLLDELEILINALSQEAQKKDKKAKSKKTKTLQFASQSKLPVNSKPKSAEARVTSSTEDNKMVEIKREELRGPVQKQNGLKIKPELAIPSGDIVLDVLVDNGKTKIGQIKVDEDFESFRLSEDLFFHIFKFDQSITTQAVEPRRNADEDVKPPETIVVAPSRTFLGTESDHTSFQITNTFNVPIIPTLNMTKIFAAYHSHNPLYHEWSEGRLPKITYEQLQKANKRYSNANQSNLGRKARSPSLLHGKVELQESVEFSQLCAVCAQHLQENQEELSCKGCGLRVHYFCYGVELPHVVQGTKRCVSEKNMHWLCDVCSNERNVITSTNYQCCLCQRDDEAEPMALKLTSSGSWCHVSCTLFNEDIPYSSLGKLQCAGDLNKVLCGNAKTSCVLCDHKGGGLVQCDLCSEKFHVTCAQRAPGYSWKFKNMSDFDFSADFVAQNCIDPTFIKPVVICPKHHGTQPNPYIPLSLRSKEGMSVLEIYSKYSKSSPEYQKSTVQMEANNVRALENARAELSSSVDARGVVETSNSDTRVECRKPCRECQTKFSIYWYNDLCYSCHNNISSLESELKMCEEESNDDFHEELDRLRFLELEEIYMKDITKHQQDSVSAVVPSRAKRARTLGVIKGRKKIKTKKEHSGTPIDHLPVVVQTLSNRKLDASGNSIE